MSTRFNTEWFVIIKEIVGTLDEKSSFEKMNEYLCSGVLNKSSGIGDKTRHGSTDVSINNTHLLAGRAHSELEGKRVR